MSMLARRLYSSISNQNVNCLTTRPIAWPSIDPSLSRWKRIFSLGKAYVNLYKTGIKNVWRNQQTVRTLKNKYNFRNVNQLTQYCVNNMFVQDISKTADQVPGPQHLTRAEYQLILRTKTDIAKLPFFAVIFAIFFETTPLLVALFPRLTPMTCYTPKAIKGHNDAKEKQIAIMSDIQPPENVSHDRLFAQSAYFLDSRELKALAFFTNKLWLPSIFYPRSHLKTIINAYIQEIQCDNMLLTRYGGPRSLDSYELKTASLDRGISIKNKTDAELKDGLENWIETFTENHYDAGYLLRRQGIEDRQTIKEEEKT